MHRVTAQGSRERPLIRRGIVIPLCYRLVIIDESHNFRNREGKIYQAIREYLERNDCKVFLLSATRYNKTYLDLGARLRIFLPHVAKQKRPDLYPDAFGKPTNERSSQRE